MTALDFRGADLTYEEFHVVRLVVDAVDVTRRLEVASGPELKGARRKLRQRREAVEGRQVFPDSEHLRLSERLGLPGRPSGIYDLGRNTGFVSIGTDYDTSAFAVASMRGWWRTRRWP